MIRVENPTVAEAHGLRELTPGEADKSRDRFTEALVGGRLLTEALSDEVFAGHPELGNRSPFIVERLSGEKGPEELQLFWKGCVDPAAGWERAVEGTLFDQNLAVRGRPLTVKRAEELMGSPIIAAAVLQAALQPILYFDADSQWSPDTIEAVAELIARPASLTCTECDHPTAAGHGPYEECPPCDDLAQTGEYAPCQKVG